MPYVIVARSDAPLSWNLHSLRGKRLALALQHPVREFLARDYADIRIVDVASGAGAMDAVARGEADAAIEVKMFANLRLHADNDGVLRTVAQVQELPAQFHFATSQAARGLVPLIDEALAEMDEPERLRLLQRWVAQDLVPEFAWRRHLPWMAALLLGLLLLAAASHELRAPTHSLSLALQALDAASLPPPQQAALRVARDATRTLAQLLNDVLDAARADQEGFVLRPQAFDLRELLDDIAQAMRPWAAEKDLALQVRLEADLPALVSMDPLRLRQVLTNLLSNALKYTGRGQISLHAQLEAAGDAAAQLMLTVRDSGPGMDAQQQARLFTPYAKVGAAHASGGTGLGLGICQRLVGLMQGHISLDSHPGQGTTVRVRLPLGALASCAAMPAQGAQVLVCDDDDTSRLLLVHMLVGHGFAVREARDGRDALQQWREGGVHAVITDLAMAGISGHELMTTLRAEEAARHAPRTLQLACSGSPVPAQAASSAPIANDAFLTKPVSVQVLVDTLSSLGFASTPPQG